MGWQWHQLVICKSFAPRFRQMTTPAPHHSVFTSPMLFLTCTTNSIKTLKAIGCWSVRSLTSASSLKDVDFAEQIVAVDPQQTLAACTLKPTVICKKCSRVCILLCTTVIQFCYSSLLSLRQSLLLRCCVLEGRRYICINMNKTCDSYIY